MQSNQTLERVDAGATYKIIVDDNKGAETVLERDLDLMQAESFLCRACNEGLEAYIVDNDFNEEMLTRQAIG